MDEYVEKFICLGKVIKTFNDKPLLEVEAHKEYAHFRKDKRDWFWLEIPEDLDVPGKNLRMWYGSKDSSLYIVYDPIPTISEIRNGEYPLEDIKGVPKFNNWMDYCKIIGMVRPDIISHHKYTLVPNSENKILKDYIEERISSTKLEMQLGPIMDILMVVASKAAKSQI